MSISYELTPCIVCGERDARLVVDAAGLRAERERLWEFHLRRLRPATPPERLADRVAFSQPDAMRLVECSVCGLLYRNPVEREHEVTGLYAEESPEPAVLSALHATQLDTAHAQARRLTRVTGRAGTVIEIGSFVGAFLAAAGALGWDARGVDVNPDVNRWLRARGAQVDDGTIADVSPSAAVDVVAFWNCFDQLADPAIALRHARALLAPGGHIVVRVPNGACYARLRTQRGQVAESILATNNLLGFPYRFGFTPASLARLLGRAGFSVREVVRDTLVPTADRYTRRWAWLEERTLKAVVRAAARGRMIEAPWLEVYARRE